MPLLTDEAISGTVLQFSAAVQGIVISSFVVGEVISAFSRMVRSCHLTEEVARESLAGFDAWSRQTRVLECTDSDVRLASTFVRRFDLALRLPDAIHLALAHRHNLHLVTLDSRMAAAGPPLGVAVEIPA